MKIEQTRDDDISKIRSMILNGKESKDIQKHCLLTKCTISQMPMMIPV